MKVAIIGGGGQMGAWFARFLSGRGHEVVISGRNIRKCRIVERQCPVSVALDNVAAVDGAELVIISVLLQDFEGVVKEIAPHVGRGQKVIDITSVKKVPVEIMHANIKGATVLGTHPVFGPSSAGKGENFVLTPTDDKERRFAGKLGSRLSMMGFNVVQVTPEEHDEAMSIILGLTHFVAFATADAWSRMHIMKYMGLSGPSFRKLKSFVDDIISSDPNFYSYLQTSLHGLGNLEDTFANSAEAIAKMVKEGRQKELMEHIRNLSDSAYSK